MNISPPTDVAKRLKQERERVGMTLQAMADAIHVGRATQSNYEAGVTSPALDYLHGLEKIGIDALYVLTGTRSSDIFTADHPDILWVAVQATSKLAAMHPDLPCSDQALGSAVIKIYRTLAQHNNDIFTEPVPSTTAPVEIDH